MNFIEKSVKTSNNVSVYSYKNPSLHSFYISLFVKAGVMHENENYLGITHFLEHISIRNVNKIYGSSLYERLDELSLEFNASTYSEMMQFYICGAAQNFKEGAEIIAKLLSPIILSPSEIDAERKRIKAELRESDDKNSLASYTNKIVFATTPLAESIIGTNKGIDRITRTKLEEYRKEITVGENIFFYVTGNFDDSCIEKLVSEIEKAEVGQAPGVKNLAPVPRNFGKRDGGVFIKNADFGLMRFTFDLDMSKYSMAETDLLYDILLSGYNSRLFVEMSEKRGIFYDISGAVERYLNIGTLNFSFEIKEKDACCAAELVVSVLNSLKTSLLADNQLMKAGYVDNAEMLYDDFRELNFTFSYDNHIMNEGYLSVEDRKRRYESITPERIKQLASEIFVPKNLTLTMKARRGKVNSKELEKIIEKLG